MRKLMDKSEKTSSLSLLLSIDEYDRVRRMRKTEAATVRFWEAVVQNKDAFVFDLLSANDVEGAHPLLRLDPPG